MITISANNTITISGEIHFVIISPWELRNMARVVDMIRLTTITAFPMLHFVSRIKNLCPMFDE